MQCDVIQVTFVYQTKSKILTYRKEYKVLENKLYYDFKLTLQFNHKKLSHRHFKRPFDNHGLLIELLLAFTSLRGKLKL
jgi:hypothetical protein